MLLRTVYTLGYISLLLPFSVLAIDKNVTPIKQNTKSFELKLGATRLIYDPESTGTSLVVINTQDYPILVQSKVFNEDKKTAAPFIVTPPLFRLDGNKQSNLRIISTEETKIKDRETLQWLCVTGIPPKPGDEWAGKVSPSDSTVLNVQLSLTSCIKLYTRPSALDGKLTDAISSINWKKDRDYIIAENASPFYINLSSVMVGGEKLSNIEYLSPFSSRSFPLPKTTSGKVEWRAILDHGGESGAYELKIN